MDSSFKKEKNECYTYFSINGNFNPDEISQKLGLHPYKSWKIGDKNKNGREYDFSAWCFGKSEVYNVIITEQMEETIAPLLDKIDLLNQIRKENDVNFCLRVVPFLSSYNDNPCLAPSLKVMDFCTATRTEIDIDLYICD
ncbi:MAG: DUF4279 domain-containing protein [Clostridia bacterium]|nr:DUF4279 domain-containing protein [Clostridia bacterium]